MNNSLSNLRWGTRSDNQLDSVRHGTHSNARKSHCPRGHIYCDANLVARKLPYRERLACERTRDHGRPKGGPRSHVDLEVADRIFADLIKAAA